MRMRKKPNMPQRTERCAAVHITAPEAYRGQWLKKLPGYRQVHLEIGCGKGKFTAETALSLPDTLLIAVERVPEALIIAMERVVRDEIPNVRFIESDASRLPELFAPGEVSRIYINFCDPWPNNGHKKRRLTHENFLRLYREVLAPGGEIHFKTDNRGLFEFSIGELTRGGFELMEVTRDLHRDGPVGVMTDYEAKFCAQGVSINRCVARLKDKSID
ncbi:tRNA (guanine-N7-)-methyltransferase [Sporobacter termitidis DSM 10068]|uniref:tRNA (guanine-N(7)-)-methyltransferase n=1 Tax=Sporobacter termitidis DSM 10068 TaxID=1123282 RepID=A0A1M5Z716_9FIRM|nr:tRNA (guanosine(46)-N7)-methyltransferase TrmB [Sporobacter termitidis]SHI20029.1 tRNA (guanine-N7-)-methyltransferase [Sporobacter termitidis DSM 10068]